MGSWLYAIPKNRTPLWVFTAVFYSDGKNTFFCHNLSVVFCGLRHTIGLQTQNDFAVAKPPLCDREV